MQKHKNLKIIKKDIRNLTSNDMNGVNTIYHLASIANDPMGALDPELTWEISCLGTMRIAELAIKNNIKKIIYASSSSVYGIKKEKKVIETLSLEPISIYTKSAEETLFLIIEFIISTPAPSTTLSPILLLL